MNEIRKNARFFAAANSYNGFVSYFDKVFDSKCYERIYVLKGGPGTGKSSLMKAIAKELSAKKCSITEIICSSDPGSLDGIIASSGNKKTAILDGTAPHERDATIPGAIDEIVNLGNNWDSRWLIAKRDEILGLNNEKKTAYTTAYKYLSLAGKCEDFVQSVYVNLFNFNEAKNKAESIFEKILTENTRSYSTLLTTSFGRYGEYNLNSLSDLAENIINVYGNRIFVALFLGVCFDYLRDCHINFIHSPSALNPQNTDAIFIPQINLFMTHNTEGQINADDFALKTSYTSEQVKCADAARRIFLDESKRWFNIASDLHFRLEDIYSKAMDFDKNQQIIKQITEEIIQILVL